MSGAIEHSSNAANQEAIDRSCRLPVLMLVVSGLIWLAVSGVAGILASIQEHGAPLFANCPLMTYGHLVALRDAGFGFGFAGNVGMGIGLWILCRVRGAELSGAVAAILGIVLWNVGIKFGLWRVLNGAGSGIEGLELPGQVYPVLLIGFGLVLLASALTYFSQKQDELHPSLWCLLAAALVFPWVMITNHQLLISDPVRGVAQSAINWWALSTLQWGCMAMVGLAVVYYLVPEQVSRPLHSRQMVGLVFWGFLVLGGWTGLGASAPLPVWMLRMGNFASVLMVFPMLALWLNLRGTTLGTSACCSGKVETKYLLWGTFGLLVALLLTVLQPVIGPSVQFSRYGDGQARLFLQGFFLLVAFGGIITVAPRLTGRNWCCEIWLKRGFWITSIGAAISSVSLLISAKAPHAFHLAAIGELALVWGGLILLFQVLEMIVSGGIQCSGISDVLKALRAKVRGGAI